MYYVYKTKNLINNMQYIGVHHSTDIENDKYLGSNMYLKRAIKKYGIQNFSRQIMYEFKTVEQAYEMQNKLVDQDWISNSATYNMCIGGRGGRKGMVVVRDKQHIFVVLQNDKRLTSQQVIPISKGKVVVRDENNIVFQTDIDDPRYVSGQLVGATKGKCLGIDNNGNRIYTQITDKRWKQRKLHGNRKGWVTTKDDHDNIHVVKTNNKEYKSNQLKHISKGLVSVKDTNGSTFSVLKTDPRYLSGELVGVAKGTIMVKTKSEEYLRVDKGDPRYLSGELVGVRKGKKHSQQFKRNASIRMKGQNNPHYGWKHSQQFKKNASIRMKGQNNPSYGKQWIHNIETHKNKYINKYEEVPYGWELGMYKSNRRMKTKWD